MKENQSQNSSFDVYEFTGDNSQENSDLLRALRESKQTFLEEQQRDMQKNLQQQELEDIDLAIAMSLNPDNNVNLNQSKELENEKQELEENTGQDKTMDGLHSYYLQSIVCHSGNLGAGHYVNYLFDPTTSKWKKHNDSTTMEVYFILFCFK
jgi:uncharacterized UBP type Zn finger protein